MAKVAHLLRAMWAVFGLVAAVLLVLASGADVLIFLLGFGSAPGSYPGQAGDRQLAVRLLVSLAVAWVALLVGVLWPALRWRRRGLYSAPGAAED